MRFYACTFYVQESPSGRVLHALAAVGRILPHATRWVSRSCGAAPAADARWAKRPPPMWQRPCQVVAPGIAAIDGAATISGSCFPKVHFITPPSPIEMCISSPFSAKEKCGRPAA
mmetsp:Transcript_13670/g.36170  ORF Transcript_13670/g.36170 Transcript_13670/m.36170 type:complete len:115 (+) Transcript_13670:171-515(+)